MGEPRTSREEITCEVVKKIAVLSENGDYTKECNLVSWNSKTPVLDIRQWRGDRPLKGLVIDDDGGRALYEGLKAYYEGKE